MANVECKEQDFFEWFKFALIVLRKHWNELDFFRINKFMYLVRLILVRCLKRIEETGFKKQVELPHAGLHHFQRDRHSDRLQRRRPRYSPLEAERGFILHIVQLYPSIALEINYPSVTELYFTFKPIFDLLSFTSIRLLRESITEKVIEEFVQYCSTSLRKEAIEFVKERLFAYVFIDTLTQPNRTKIYQIIESLDVLLENDMFSQQGIGLKEKKKRSSSSQMEIEAPVLPAAAAPPTPKQKKAKKVLVAKKVAAQKELAKTASSTKPPATESREEVEIAESAPEAQDWQPIRKTNSKELSLQAAEPGRRASDEKKNLKKMARDLRELENQQVTFISSLASPDPPMDLDQLYADMGVVDGAEEEDETDVMDGMAELDYEELKKKLPPYFFMPPKRKQKYFKKITSDYMQQLKKTDKDKEKTQRVNFQLDQVKTKGSRCSAVFNKLHKVSAEPVVTRKISKKILKR